MSISADISPRTDGSYDQDAAVIAEQPPPWTLRAIGWLLIGIFGTAAAAAVVVKVPETVECPYVLVPKSGADPIQSPLLAVVAEVLVVEGQQVAAGDPLFVLRSDEIRGWQTQLRTLREDLRSGSESVVKLQSSYASELSIRDSEVEQYERELEFQRHELKTRRSILERISKLEKEGVISPVELMEHTLRLAAIEKDINLIQKSLQQVILARQRLDTERSRRLAEERTELDKLQLRADALEEQLKDCEGAHLIVRATYPAVVISLAERSTNNVVQPGQQLCQLARLEAGLQARLHLSEERLALVLPEQRVRLFFDAFPYQRYGTITGRLDWVSPAAVTSAGGQQFIGLASLDETAFTVDGELRPLRVGMTGFARIIVGSRSLAEIAFEPLRRLREETRG